MKFETAIFDEPHLEFGDKHHHPDPRLGLHEAGPLQTPLGDAIRIAVVGNAKTIEDTKRYLDDATAGFPGKTEKHPNLHPDFPGLGNLNPFRCKFEFAENAAQAIPQARIEAILKEPNHDKAVRMAADEVMQRIFYLTQIEPGSDY